MAGFQLDRTLPVASFTGTQAGTTPAQREVLWELLGTLAPYFAHHGDCVGADADFHEICISGDVQVIIHPPTDPKRRAWCQGAAKILTPRPYLERNRDIVVAGTFLIATPKEFEEQLRSGTWSTVRYARKLSRPLYLVLPNGEVREENTCTTS